MACNIAHGRVNSCKDSIGGLKNIYFINEDITSNYIYRETFLGSGFYVVDTDFSESIEYVNFVQNLYKYELKSNENVFDQEIVSSRENGTTFVRQTLTIKLKKQDSATHTQVKLLAYANPRILVETNEGQFFLVGLLRGAELISGSVNSGGALADFSGYSLTFQAEEMLAAQFVESGTDSFYYDIDPAGGQTLSTIVS